MSLKTCYRTILINIVLLIFSLLETEENCPMCSEKIMSENLPKITDLNRIIYVSENDD